MSAFSWVSTILTILCFAWVVGLLIFVLVKVIIRKVKYKKEQRELIKDYERSKHDERRKKSK